MHQVAEFFEALAHGVALAEFWSPVAIVAIEH